MQVLSQYSFLSSLLTMLESIQREIQFLGASRVINDVLVRLSGRLSLLCVSVLCLPLCTLLVLSVLLSELLPHVVQTQNTADHATPVAVDDFQAFLERMQLERCLRVTFKLTDLKSKR